MTDDKAVSLIPEVDGVALVDMVAVFEADNGYTPAGAYGGIGPNDHDLTQFYLGVEAYQRSAEGQLRLLGCDCGIESCWPLTATVDVTDETVTWHHFEQPHREEWDYAAFGPFEFGRAQYESAVREAARGLPR